MYLHCMAQHPTTITQGTVVQCHGYFDMSVTKQQYSQPVGCFTQVRWQVVGSLQLHCLSRLKLFILCVCTFIYLSSLHDRQWVALVLAVLTISHVSMLIYWNTWIMSGCTRIFGTCVQQKRDGWYIDRFSDTITPHACMVSCHDQCGARLGSPQLLSVHNIFLNRVSHNI